MNDPLSEVIALLRPRAVSSRRISGAGRWGVRYSAFGQPSFCAVLEGSCRLTVDGQRPLTLEAADFVLLPATPGFTMSGFDPVRFERLDPHVRAKVLGETRHGRRGGRPCREALRSGPREGDRGGPASPGQDLRSGADGSGVGHDSREPLEGSTGSIRPLRRGARSLALPRIRLAGEGSRVRGSFRLHPDGWAP